MPFPTNSFNIPMKQGEGARQVIGGLVSMSSSNIQGNITGDVCKSLVFHTPDLL
jgi:hypothetical protein